MMRYQKYYLGIAPGTEIRYGLENILKARTGALLLFTSNEEIIEQIVDGGFYIDEEYSSSKLYELAKMDGAIVLSGDMKRILFANAELIPSYEIPTVETGTRHRTAERTAKQTGELVISISQRRNIITIFKGNERYILEDTEVVLNRANQALNTLEKYKKVFNNKLDILNEYEFNEIVTLDNVLQVIQRIEMIMEIADEIKRNIAELGEDGRLISMQLEQLIGGIEKEEIRIVKDYKLDEKLSDKDIIDTLNNIKYEDLLKENNIAKALGYDLLENYEDITVEPRGYRILSKIPRVPNNTVENLVNTFNSFKSILYADTGDLVKVEGIGEIRAQNIKTSLNRMKDQFVFENILD